MPTIVSLSLFSGRPNPRIELSPAAAEELRNRIRRLRGGRRERVWDARPFGIGILRVTREDRTQLLCGAGLIELALYPYSYPDTEGIEAFLIEQFPDSAVPAMFKRKLKAQIATRAVSPKMKRYKPCKGNAAVDAQPFDPFWGTLGYNHWPCNNCYDYANNQITDTYSQPGYGSGQVFTAYSAWGVQALSLASVRDSIKAAAIRDGLVSVTTLTDPLKKPGSGWYVALLLGSAPIGGGKREWDYHWIKQDKSGCWSHKLGSGAVWNTDSNFAPIYDPQTAVFNFGGVFVYDKFAGYFRTTAKAMIKGFDPTTNCYDWGWS